MSVLLRCPNCGTTQRHLGECDACSEGEVRYFCTNHDEGIWLDGPVCSRCGARFGDALKGSASTPAPPSITTRPAGAPDFRPPTRRRTSEDSEEPDFGIGRPRRRDLDDRSDAEVVPSEPSLADLLEEITEAHRARRTAHEADDVPWPAPPTGGGGRPGLGFPIGGCLVRIFGLGVLLFLAFVVFMFVLFGGLIGG